MNIKQISEKFKDILSEEDLITTEKQIKKLVSEQVAIRVEAEVDRLTEKADEFCELQISEKVSEAEVTMAEDYEQKLDLMEDTIVDKLDKFLDSEISEKISDDMLKSVAINETFKPIINGIQGLFENKFVALDSEGEGKLRESEDKIAELEEKNISLISEKMEISEMAELAATKLLISEKSDELTESERDRLVVLTEGKDFEEIHSKIDTFVDMVTESSDESSELLVEDDETTSSDELIVEDAIDYSDKDKDSSQLNAFAFIDTLL